MATENTKNTEGFVLPRSRLANERLHAMIPGGAHTYAKGDDQYPENLAPVISHGRGAHVWDIDGNRYVEYGSGLRSVSLGHADLNSPSASGPRRGSAPPGPAGTSM